MLKNFKKMIFTTTAIAASGLCLGAFFLSPLNASGPENVEEICNQAHTSLEEIKKACNFKITENFPEYNAKSNSLGKYGECYDFVPLPQARIDFASPMKVNGNDKNHNVQVVRMLAFDKNDNNAGNLDIIKNLSDDERNKLFDEYDLNSKENKIDVSIEVYDLSKDRTNPANKIHTKMRKMNKTIKGRNFVEFAIELPANFGFIPAQVRLGRVKLYKTDGAARKCISDVYYSADYLDYLHSEKDVFITSVMNFNKDINDMLINSIINFNRDVEKSGKDSLPEYDAETNTLGRFGECSDLVPMLQTGISSKAGNNDEFVVQRMLAFDKNDKDAGNLDDIKDLLDDKNKLFEEYDLNSTKDKIDVSINVYDFSKHDNSLSNVIKAKMRKIPRTINGHKFVEFAIERPANCNLTPDEVPIGMIRIVKNDGSEECISEVRFAGASALKTESDLFINSIIKFNNGVVYKG